MKTTHTGTVYDGVYHTPLGRFTMLDISTAAGIVSGAEKVGVGTSRRRDRSEDVSFGIGTHLVVERSSLENRPRSV